MDQHSIASCVFIVMQTELAKNMLMHLILQSLHIHLGKFPGNNILTRYSLPL